MDDATLERLLRSTIDAVDAIQTRTSQSDRLIPIDAPPALRLRKVFALSTASLVELMQLADGQMQEGSILVSMTVLGRIGVLLDNFITIINQSAYLIEENDELVRRVLDEYNEKLTREQGA